MGNNVSKTVLANTTNLSIHGGFEHGTFRFMAQIVQYYTTAPTDNLGQDNLKIYLLIASNVAVIDLDVDGTLNYQSCYVNCCIGEHFG